MSLIDVEGVARLVNQNLRSGLGRPGYHQLVRVEYLDRDVEGSGYIPVRINHT